MNGQLKLETPPRNDSIPVDSDRQEPRQLATCCSTSCSCASQKMEKPTTNFMPRQMFINAGLCASTIPGVDQKELYRCLRWMFNDMHPKNALEGILVSQIMGTYQVMMHQLHLISRESSLEGANTRTNMVARLQKMMTQQLSQLATLRGEVRPQQVMRIERVDVTGGQTVIGPVAKGVS